MTENEIKEMLKDIIDNGAEYEYTCKDSNGDYCPYRKYKLGMEIYSYCEYRKVENWYVYLESDGSYILLRKRRIGKTIFDKIIFEGTEEECKKWIEEHTKKTWLEERKSCLSVSFSKEVINGYSAGVTEVCKKILEVEHNLEVNSETTEGFVIGKNQLRDIIKDLGVEV